MLSTFPFTFLIYSTLFMSTMMALSSSNWLFMWLALEINMMSFIPLLTATNSNLETESTIKYFLIQALGSSMLLIYSTSMWYNFIPSTMMPIMLMFSLLIKLGAAPFHFWFPQVMSSSHWLACFLLATWQKLAPLALLCFMFSGVMPLFLFAGGTALVGGMMGVNQTKLRALMAYSSLVHMGWIMSLTVMNHPAVAMLYFMLYVLITLPIFLCLYSFNINYISFTSLGMMFAPLLPLYISLLLLSLSGIPPLTGFAPKWISMTYLWNTPGILLILIMSSLMSTYYYLNIIFSSLMTASQSSMTPTHILHPISLFTIATSSLFISPLLIY